MQIAILILAYLLLASEIISIINKEPTNMLIMSPLIILLSWQANTAWGITMCVILPIITLIGMVTCDRKKRK